MGEFAMTDEVGAKGLAWTKFEEEPKEGKKK